jgi:hypothetical protein
MSSLVTYEDVSGAGWSSWPTLSVAHIVITPATTADSLCTAASSAGCTTWPRQPRRSSCFALECQNLHLCLALHLDRPFLG